VAHHGGMFRSAQTRFAATLLVSVLGFVMTLYEPAGGLLDEPLAMQMPQR
jgi:hypothetical protein